MILDKIIEYKRKKVKESKRAIPLRRFKRSLQKPSKSFKDAISRPGLNIIAEIKERSPSSGQLKNFDFENLACEYQNNYRVSAVSILTDHKFFGGERTHINEAKRIINKPILRKDFIISEYQVYESRLLGADAILLIARILKPKQLKKLSGLAKRLGMDCLFEVHDEDDLGKVIDFADIIGINNRNLDTLKVDIETTLGLLNKISPDKVIVSESGFAHAKDVEKVKGRVNSLLVGASLIESTNISQKIKELLGGE